MYQGGAGALAKKHGDGSLLLRLAAFCLGKGKAEATGGVLDQVIVLLVCVVLYVLYVPLQNSILIARISEG